MLLCPGEWRRERQHEGELWDKAFLNPQTHCFVGSRWRQYLFSPGWCEIHYVTLTDFKLALIFLFWPLSTKTAHLSRPILDTIRETNLGVQSHTEGKRGERSHRGHWHIKAEPWRHLALWVLKFTSLWTFCCFESGSHTTQAGLELPKMMMSFWSFCLCSPIAGLHHHVQFMQCRNWTQGSAYARQILFLLSSIPSHQQPFLQAHFSKT